MRRIGIRVLASLALLVLVGLVASWLVASAGEGFGSAEEDLVKQVATPAANPPEPVKDKAAQETAGAEDEPANNVTTPAASPSEPAEDNAAQEAEKTKETTGTEEEPAKDKSAQETVGAGDEEQAATAEASVEQYASQYEEQAAVAEASEEQYASEGEEGAAAAQASEVQYASEGEVEDESPASRQYVASEAAAAPEVAAPEVAAPEDPTMYLSVPKLGIAGTVVADGEAGLELGTMHLSGTGYPWLPGSNTYIAGHRVGFPGTGSDHIFFDLPSLAQGDEITLEDSNGQAYTYQVTETFAVTPTDTWVTAPAGDDMITLQVCTESPEDWFTIGPSLMASGPDSGRLIVRAIRVA